MARAFNERLGEVEGKAGVFADGLFDALDLEDVKELVETIISDSWSFPALRP